MKLLKIVPAETKIPFISFRKFAFLLSAVAIVLSIGMYQSKGLNFGIDFRGGTLIEIATVGPADIAKIRSIVGGLDLGDSEIQSFGSDTEVLIRIARQEEQTQEDGGEIIGAEQAQQLAVTKVRAALDSQYGSAIEYRRIEVVGPKVSGELVKAGTIAVVVAVFLMLCYIWWRFEWQFSLGAIVALVHDVILTIGIFSFLQLDFDLSTIAALLTIVGYSMNDTVVVYDRVRENLRKYKKMSLEELLNLSINSTLSRTVMTSLTTLLALFSLFILGGAVIKGFTFAMIWGVFIGTYSSVFVAAPILLVVGVKRDWSSSDGSTAVSAT